MVKVVHVPDEAAQYLSANELSGWADGVHYTPPHTHQTQEEEPAPVTAPQVQRVPIGRRIVTRRK